MKIDKLTNKQAIKYINKQTTAKAGFNLNY